MILIFFLIILAATLPVIILLGPQLDFSLLVPEIEFEEPEPEKPVEVLDADMQRYFQLKNISCDTLSGDFLIVTYDAAEGTLQGLVPVTEDETMFAEAIVDAYDLSQTTRTYVRGDQMKKVVISEGAEATTIWKNGRIYNCTANCTMRLMSEDDSKEYYDTLKKIKTNCAYFGKTELPDSVNISRLFDVERTETLQINSFICENFLITANKTYLETINESLDEDQAAFFWGLGHLDGPVQECLDESAGIIVLRNLTLDLTGSYNFEFEENGSIKVNQVTRLTYFTDNVPESFLALPD